MSQSESGPGEPRGSVAVNPLCSSSIWRKPLQSLAAMATRVSNGCLYWICDGLSHKDLSPDDRREGDLHHGRTPPSINTNCHSSLKKAGFVPRNHNTTTQTVNCHLRREALSRYSTAQQNNITTRQHHTRRQHHNRQTDRRGFIV
jgi:hypothetical protein